MQDRGIRRAQRDRIRARKGQIIANHGGVEAVTEREFVGIDTQDRRAAIAYEMAVS
jgi:hypothetical protein